MKKCAGLIVLVMFSLLSLCGEGFALSISRPSKYNASAWQSWETKYGGNCYLFVNNLLRTEGRPLIEYRFTGGATIQGYTPISGGQVIKGSRSISASDVKAVFANTNVGYVVQMYWRWSRYTPHTAIVSARDDYGVEFLHANYYSGTITNNYFSWSQLAQVFNNAGSNGGLSVYQLGAAPYQSGIKIDSAHFPDPVFRDYVRYYDKNGDGYFSDEELNAVTDFGWHGGSHPDNVNPNAWSGYEPKALINENGNGQKWKNIRSIEGVKLFKNLESLYVYNDSLSGTIDISGMTKLKDFRCYGNRISSINASNCSSLERLECQNNTNLSFINIIGCSNLAYLDVSHNILMSLEVNVNATPKLKFLDCSNNRLSSLNVSLMDIEELYCSNNRLTSLYVMSAAYLKELWCSNNSLTYLHLFSCPKLEVIRCKNNNLTTIYIPGRSRQNLRILERDAKLDFSAFLPRITSDNVPRTAYVGKNYSGYIRATGDGVITYSSSILALSNGINIDEETGNISGTPTLAHDSVTFKFYASNFAGSVSKSYTIDIKDSELSPKITTSSIASLKKGTYYWSSPYASPNRPIKAESNALPITWSKYSGTLPPGMKLVPYGSTSVYLAGRPTESGRYTFTIMARDKNGLYTTKQFNVYVYNN